MECSQIVEFFKGKSILITGSTGFLAKIFVEKVLRIQPEVKRLFLLIRAENHAVAEQRMQDEILGKELFNVLKEKHGEGFHSFIADKVVPVAGDIVEEHLGINNCELREKLWKEINIVVNGAATTSFDERYDVSLAINVLGAKHVLEFAKKCSKLQMFLHISTAYVVGLQDGLIQENRLRMGETLKDGTYLDLEAEFLLADERKNELRAWKSTKETEKQAMKQLGLERAKHFGWPNTYVYTKAMGEMLLGSLRGNVPLVILRPTIITSIAKDPLPGWVEGTRTIDTLIVGYAKAKVHCFLADPKAPMDVIPGDMVVNAMIATILAHANQQSEIIYHISSSVRNHVTYPVLVDSGFKYFMKHPRTGKDGKVIKTVRLPLFSSILSFKVYTTLRYRLPLEVMHMLNILSFGFLAQRYSELSRKYKFVMYLVDLYAPYAFFKGCFDDINMEKLRIKMANDSLVNSVLDFDPKHIDWGDYFYSIHIPGVLKYVCK